jgi:NAD(P)-dependent dehydrogenase (short-subunit alcohol dehydrogenase family)
MTKTVLVTAGNRGLGLAVVKSFEKAGWTVLATARKVDDSLPATATDHRHYVLDLSSQASLDALVSQILSEGHRIDCIIHNAGFNPKDVKDRPGYFESTFYMKDFRAEAVAESCMINALYPMELTGKLLPVLTKDAVVIAISSWLGSMEGKNVPGHYGYSGSKALMNMMIKGLSMEFAKDTSTSRSAVVLNPGWMRTDMGGSNADKSPEQVAKAVTAMTADGFISKNNGKFLNTDRTEHPW